MARTSYPAFLLGHPIYTECPRRNVPHFGRMFLMLKYTDITQNNYVQSWTVTEIMAREVWNFDSCYTLIDFQTHIKTVVSVMLMSVLNIKLTCEWHKAIKLNYKNTRTHVIVVLSVPSTIHDMNAQRWRNMADCAFRIHSSSLSRADCNVGEPHHVGSIFGSVSLTGCLPTNLVNHSAGRLHTHFPINCCQRQKVRSTCYQAHHTIHSL
jgi:hypothetical protein